MTRALGLLAVVRFEAVTAMTMKIIYRDVTPCSLVDICKRFRGTKCLHLQDKEYLRGYRAPYPRRQ